MTPHVHKKLNLGVFTDTLLCNIELSVFIIKGWGVREREEEEVKYHTVQKFYNDFIAFLKTGSS